jgi:hypothetical protein
MHRAGYRIHSNHSLPRLWMWKHENSKKKKTRNVTCCQTKMFTMKLRSSTKCTKITRFYRNQRSIAVFTTARHWASPWARPTQSTHYPSIHLMMFCKLEIYHCRYAVSGYHGNELLSVNILHESNLRSRSRMGEQFHFCFTVSCIFYEYWYSFDVAII